MILILDRYSNIYLLKYNDNLYCIDKMTVDIGMTLHAYDNIITARKQFNKMKKEYEKGVKWYESKAFYFLAELGKKKEGIKTWS